MGKGMIVIGYMIVAFLLFIILVLLYNMSFDNNQKKTKRHMELAELALDGSMSENDIAQLEDSKKTGMMKALADKDQLNHTGVDTALLVLRNYNYEEARIEAVEIISEYKPKYFFNLGAFMQKRYREGDRDTVPKSIYQTMKQTIPYATKQLGNDRVQFLTREIGYFVTYKPANVQEYGHRLALVINGLNQLQKNGEIDIGPYLATKIAAVLPKLWQQNKGALPSTLTREIGTLVQNNDTNIDWEQARSLASGPMFRVIQDPDDIDTSSMDASESKLRLEYEHSKKRTTKYANNFTVVPGQDRVEVKQFYQSQFVNDRYGRSTKNTTGKTQDKEYDFTTILNEYGKEDGADYLREQDAEPDVIKRFERWCEAKQLSQMLDGKSENDSNTDNDTKKDSKTEKNGSDNKDDKQDIKPIVEDYDLLLDQAGPNREHDSNSYSVVLNALIEAAKNAQAANDTQELHRQLDNYFQLQKRAPWCNHQLYDDLKDFDDSVLAKTAKRNRNVCVDILDLDDSASINTILSRLRISKKVG